MCMSTHPLITTIRKNKGSMTAFDNHTIRHVVFGFFNFPFSHTSFPIYAYSLSALRASPQIQPLIILIIRCIRITLRNSLRWQNGDNFVSLYKERHYVYLNLILLLTHLAMLVKFQLYLQVEL